MQFSLQLGNRMTAEELATEVGRTVSTMQKRWEKAFPGISFSRKKELSSAELKALTKESEMPGKKVLFRKGSVKNSIVKNPAASNEVPPAKTWFTLPKINIEKLGLYALMAIPAIASVQNMHTVTGHLTESVFASLVLTALFSVSPFLFVMVGAKSVASKVLVVLMVGYECFCNTMRIYGGLTRFGIDGYPTRFLGLVTDFCNSGTYATARFLAVFMAALAAGIFYIAYWQLNKSK